MRSLRRLAVAMCLVAGSASAQPRSELTATSDFATERALPKVGAPIRPVAMVVEPAAAPDNASLDGLIRVALERHPRLAKANFAVEAARGRALQAGLYPNPVLSATADELNDRQGRGGIITAPYLSQEIVTGGKLGIGQAAAAKEIDQATLALLAERFALLAAVRTAYADAAILQRRVEILGELATLAEESASRGKKLLDQGLLAELDFIQLETEQERVRAILESARKELAPARRRLAATVGVPDLPVSALTNLDSTLPEYDLDQARTAISATHPTLRSAKIGVERAQIAARRAEVDWIPNVTVSGGFVRQNQNKSNDFSLGVSLPLPTWNRNQGGILAAHAEAGAAARDVDRLEAELVEKLATTHRTFVAAKELAERYGKSIIPRAEKSYQLSAGAFKGGQFEYLRVLQAQRSLAEARLESLRATGEAWRAAGELSGLLLEETWPPKKD